MVLNLFSKRRRRERGELPDTYRYDELPQPLRVQIVHVIRDAFEPAGGPDHEALDLYKEVHDLLAREYGLFELHEDAKYRQDFRSALFNFFLQTKDVEQALDVVEFTLRCAMYVVPEWRYAAQRRTNASVAIAEINERFREHGVGYQFESGEIIRVDSQLLHAELIKPVLALLSDHDFSGANEEFLKAHEHYRHGRNKEALVECLKAFESTMKVICDQRGWRYEKTAPAKKLIEVCFDNALVPAPLQAQFGALRSTLESGVPTVRNKMGGHGQGSEPVEVPAYLVEYTLNLTASAIRLLYGAHTAA